MTTTEILADLARNVGGERVHVDSIVPSGGDPHSYEPTPSDAVMVSKADVTFTNHLLLEEHALIKAIDANARQGTPNVSLAEDSEAYGAHVIPLVENIGLDVLWLGLRVKGEGHDRGATRASDIVLSATAVTGPGRLVAYLTEALGKPVVYFDSGDGLDARDATTLPPGAHTHLNWAFTQPGVYEVTLAARLRNPGAADEPALGQATFRFAVGVDPHALGLPPDTRVLDQGHTDLAVDLDKGAMFAYADGDKPGLQADVPPEQAVLVVPNKAIQTVPDDPRFAFLGTPGSTVHQLPQAVLGKHVHGEIDPHLWQDVQNAKAYVQIIRDTLTKADPEGADAYAANTRAYLETLDRTDTEVRATIARIPVERRQLVTTHDAFGYLADAYAMTVAGFVVPNPAQEPSADDIRKLTATVKNLKVPAVFIEPNLARRALVLRQVAEDQNIRVCTLYGDAFDAKVRDYVAMMHSNANELLTCLGGAA
ncbi:anchored repeat ABC transporter, substrate-binding protein [Yinghuangia sp. ASG 101]|uniref:anchored repeat ABC transporter, substrate-binding protein n=1 Tax=Yinghuangia sp. ASG 101 TaxID=2896848 RepID=UPI001E32FC46|nr:anchored repeat ABC transporter, substrate-binding protein [Yinghuangia sp. ASG 101]UGQ13950.1 anchored repeat ABC transporter, substrate-binding protein [Yinghuangia sp. ASG 101]